MKKIEELKRMLPAIQDSVKLRNESVKSLCGACPKCGGEDRFVYRTDKQRFWCRQCNEKGGDVINFHAWFEGTDVKGLMKKYLPDEDKPFVHFQLGDPVEKYPYTDARGKVLYWNCRFEPKAFRQCSADGSRWSTKDIKPKVPYQLSKMIAANTVFIVEGEKDCHGLAKLNLVGTCNVAGAGNWTSDLNHHFKGKDVFLIPDNDDAGRKHISNVCKNLKDIAANIKLIELPGLPERGDFTDWLNTFEDIDLAVEKFAKMIDGAKPHKPNEPTEDKPKSDLTSEVLAIIDLDPLTREQERNRISKEHNVRVKIIDEFIKELKKREKDGGTKEIVTEIEPATESISGDKLLSAIKETLLKYVILPGGVAEPISAWVVLTYCYDSFRILPLLGIISPVKRCGKTTLLEILQGLTNKGLTASNISPAAVFRTIEKYSPTLLVDEADTFLKDNDELRGVLNSGHTRSSAFVVRVQGDDHEPVRFSTWGAKAVSMIGTLPDTLHDRSVVVSLRRKAPGETVSRINIDFEKECLELRRSCRKWADDHMDALRETNPDIPTTNNDRVTDNWMPLLAIADVAGGDWAELMRKSMLGMFDAADDSIGPKLLYDIQDIFKSHLVKRIFSSDLVEALKDKKESPWCDWNRGKGLTQNGLARLLKPFSVRSEQIRIGEKSKKGYESISFKDVFKRYIPLTPLISSETTKQHYNINNIEHNQSETNNDDVSDDKQHKQLELNDCFDVSDEKGGVGKDIPQWKKLKFESEEEYLKMISQ